MIWNFLINCVIIFLLYLQYNTKLYIAYQNGTKETDNLWIDSSDITDRKRLRWTKILNRK